jgi:hypothetical protein
LTGGSVAFAARAVVLGERRHRRAQAASIYVNYVTEHHAEEEVGVFIAVTEKVKVINRSSGPIYSVFVKLPHSYTPSRSRRRPAASAYHQLIDAGETVTVEKLVYNHLARQRVREDRSARARQYQEVEVIFTDAEGLPWLRTPETLVPAGKRKRPFLGRLRHRLMPLSLRLRRLRWRLKWPRMGRHQALTSISSTIRRAGYHIDKTPEHWRVVEPKSFDKWRANVRAARARQSETSQTLGIRVPGPRIAPHEVKTRPHVSVDTAASFASLERE